MAQLRILNVSLMIIFKVTFVKDASSLLIRQMGKERYVY